MVGKNEYTINGFLYSSINRKSFQKELDIFFEKQLSVQSFLITILLLVILQKQIMRKRYGQMVT